MDQNIRKIVEAAERLCIRLPDGTQAAAPLCPRQNVAKSVAKARKRRQVTTPQPQPHQQHRRHFPQKTPHPPPCPAKPGEFGNLGDGICGSGYPFPRFLPIESPDFNLMP